MINNVVLTGRLTAEPEIKKTPSGISVLSFTLAVGRKYSNSGEKETDFINCQAWRGSADFLSQYARKGDMIGVEGRIQTRSWNAPDGSKRYATEVIANSVELLSKVERKETQPIMENEFESFDESDLPF